MFTYYKNIFLHFFKSGVLETEIFLCMCDHFKGGNRKKLFLDMLVFNNAFYCMIFGSEIGIDKRGKEQRTGRQMICTAS